MSESPIDSPFLKFNSRKQNNSTNVTTKLIDTHKLIELNKSLQPNFATIVDSNSLILKIQ